MWQGDTIIETPGNMVNKQHWGNGVFPFHASSPWWSQTHTIWGKSYAVHQLTFRGKNMEMNSSQSSMNICCGQLLWSTGSTGVAEWQCCSEDGSGGGIFALGPSHGVCTVFPAACSVHNKSLYMDCSPLRLCSPVHFYPKEGRIT